MINNTSRTIVSILTISIICVATMMSGCIEEKNTDGFKVDEVKDFDFVYEQSGTELDMVGNLEWDGEHYIIYCEFESVIGGLMFVGKSEGPANNVRTTILCSGVADVSYNNCEGTPLLDAMIENAK